jgi:excisionase family DNA binding protein
MEPRVLTVREFASVMKISDGLAYRMCREGKIRTVRFGDRYLIPIKVVDEILDGASYNHSTDYSLEDGQCGKS